MLQHNIYGMCARICNNKDVWNNGFYANACKYCNLYGGGKVILGPIAPYGNPVFAQGKPQ